jgi:hypothetical protein
MYFPIAEMKVELRASSWWCLDERGKYDAVIRSRDVISARNYFQYNA